MTVQKKLSVHLEPAIMDADNIAQELSVVLGRSVSDDHSQLI